MTNAYSKKEIARIRAIAAKIVPDVRKVCHVFPRAYCIAKPAPCCAVFVTPWMDAEPQVRDEVFSASRVVHEGSTQVKVGDWCSLAYVAKTGCGQVVVIEILK